MRPQHKLYPMSRNDTVSTPDHLFERINAEFHFTVDAAADPDNAKCPVFWTIEDNGLLQVWAGHRVWCNPPYSQCAEWTAKAHYEASALSVLLLPVRTSAGWFHDFVLPRAEVRFVRKRIQFVKGTNAPFDSMLAIYRPA